MREHLLDLLVLGGGPVGMATALSAAQAGLSVELWEPRAQPVDKACGEGLMPGAVAALRRLGVEPEGHPIAGIRYLQARTSVTADFSAGPGLGVRRTTLHRHLSAATARAGVIAEARSARQIENRADHVLVNDTRARYVIAADGLHSPTRRRLGLERPPSRIRRFGLRAHVAMPARSDYVDVHWSRLAEAYVTPVSEDLVGVAILTDQPGSSFEELLTQFPELCERIGSHPRGPVRGAGPLRQRAHRRVAGRVLLVGDAAGYVDALTGEGIALGLAQARAAVNAVVAEVPGRYEADARRLGRRHELLTHGLLTVSRIGVARQLLVPAARCLPSVFSLAVNQLARPA